MGIFHKRPFMLCWACLLFTAAILYYFAAVVKIAVMTVLAAVTVTLAICLLLGRGKRRRIGLTVALIAVVFSLLAAATSYLYYDVWVGGYESESGKVSDVEALVTSVDRGSDFFTEYDVTVKRIDGERRYGKAKLILNYHGTFHVGDVITVKATGTSLKEVAADRISVSALYAEGYVAAFTSENDVPEDANVTGDGSAVPAVILSNLNSELSRKLSEGIGGDAGALSAAIFLGNRGGLSDEIARDFTRSGIVHLLAISGTHIAVIAALAEGVMALLGMKKRARCFVMIPLLLGYLCLTGGSISATRSVLMCIAAYLAFMRRYPPDPLTVLFTVCGAIVLLSPAAVSDVGFWMSFSATCGIIVAAPYVAKILKRNQKESKLIYGLKTAGRAAVSAVLVSLTASFAIAVIMWYEFGEASVIAPVTNLLTGFAVSGVIILAPIYLLVCGIPWLAAPVAWLSRGLSSYVLTVSSALSAPRYSVVSLKYGFAAPLTVTFGVAMAVLLVINLGKRKWAVLIPPAALVLTFSLCLGVFSAVHGNETGVTYLRQGEREMLVAVNSGRAFICDISDGNYSNFYIAEDEASDMYATEVEVLMLTHYHDKYTVSLRTFLGRHLVRRLWLPEPMDHGELLILQTLCTVAEEYGTVVTVYERGDSLRIFGQGSVTVLPYERLDRSAQPAVGLVIEYGQTRLTYIGSSYFETRSAATAIASANESELLILGTHGPNIKEAYELPIGANTSDVVFADDTVVAKATVPPELNGQAELCLCPERWHTVLD